MKEQVERNAPMRSMRRMAHRRINFAHAAVALLLVALILFDLLFMPLDRLARLVLTSADGTHASLTVHYIDVEDGDSIFLEFPDGKTMLIDGGDGSAEHNAAIMACLDSCGVQTLDAVMATHMNADHTGGLAAVAVRYKPKRAYIPLTDEEDLRTNESYAAFYAAAQSVGTEFVLSQNFRTVLSEDKDNFYYWMILSPRSPLIEESEYHYADAQAENDISAVVYLEFAGRRFLFMGDAGTRVEERLTELARVLGDQAFWFPAEAQWGTVEVAPDLRSLDFLKAGHHGSKNATGTSFLRFLDPDNIIFTVGAGNRYGHPSLETLTRIREVVPDAKLLRTDESGTITVRVSSDGTYTIATSAA